MKLSGANVLVLGDISYAVPFYGKCKQYLVLPSEKVRGNDVAWADLIVFTGGTDVDPHIYGEDRMALTDNPDKERDDVEIDVFNAAIGMDKAMVGICRGAQFLCVMNLGQLIQHVDNHSRSHLAYSPNTDISMTVTSSHHQMMLPNPNVDHETLLYAKGLSNLYMTEGVMSLPKDEGGKVIEPEVILWRGSKCLAHQPHPEWMEEESTYHQYFLYTVEKLLEL